MINVYHQTVGRNCLLELDLAPDRSGLIPARHAARYKELGDFIRTCYGSPITQQVSNTTIAHGVALTFEYPTSVDRIVLMEDQTNGQVIRAYEIYAKIVDAEEMNGTLDVPWSRISSGNSVGHKRIDLLTEAITVTDVIVNATKLSMKGVRNMLGCIKPSSEPSGVDGDDVYPLHMLDDTNKCRESFLAWTLRFNDVLDAHRLHDSLSRLLEMGDWKKLGGRLGFNSNGGLELCVPKRFTGGRPAVAFSHDESSSGLRINEHPLASRLPKAMAEPSFQPGAIHFRSFAAKPDVPSSINDAISHDAPQLSLHITSFKDATLVGISFPHILMDALGFEALLRSWSLVLAGREAEVPPVLGARNDVLWATAARSIGSKSDESFVIGKKRLQGVSYLKFLLRFMRDKFRDPTMENQIVYLPNSAVAQLRRQAMGSMKSASNNEPHEDIFISEGDILAAWIAQTIASSASRPRPVTILRAINARFRLGSILQTPEKGVYVQNMVLASFVCLSPQVARGPLGTMALENRRQLAEQTTEQQMLILLQVLRQRIESGRQPTILSGEPDSLPIVFNDLTKVNLIGAVDFKLAVSQQGDSEGSRSNPIGTMVYHHFQSLKENAWRRNWVVVLGKDHQDGTWVMADLTRKSSLTFEEVLKHM
ncbi:hypothetical protein VMCG_06946 [Cytospora schulzeri]|uniref:Uncharacterized protein n=1 Tax=Cytospora schulzeri TaxID=448051 RepID=A0A423W275_9PEZI|nr:hypothetical protein VMCG_06946 [Valsa malicola]